MLTMQTLLDLAAYLLIAVMVSATVYHFWQLRNERRYWLNEKRELERQERERHSEPWTQVWPPDDDRRPQ